MEKKQVKTYKPELNLYKIIWHPIVVLVIAFMMIIVILSQIEVRSNNKALRNAVELRLLEQKEYFSNEIFLKEPDAIKLRVESIVNSLETLYRGVFICVEVVSEYHNDSLGSYKYCTNNEQQKFSLQKISINKIPLLVGEKEIGKIHYFTDISVKWHRIIPSKILFGMLIALIISLITQYFLVKRLYRVVVNPLLQTISNSARNQAFSELARQVAHDIRSPLTVLTAITQGLLQLPNDIRSIVKHSVQRINDIANNLLNKYENDCLPDSLRSRNVKPELISLIASEIMSEKRIQYANLAIDFSIDVNDAYGIFANIQSSLLKRALSNLINNSVEAISESGKIILSIKQATSEIIIEIIDNGKGIPAELLPIVFEKGKSFNKPTGSGLGLSFSKECIESWGGKIFISSKCGVGTTIKILLPRTEAPLWFANNIVIKPGMIIVVIDDDKCIHDIWHTRFDNEVYKNHGIILVDFFDPLSIEPWHKENANKNVLFLVDYEFIGYDTNGVDVIKKFNINENSILITGRSEEPEIRNICLANNVKMAPKDLAMHIPITLLQAILKITGRKKALLLNDDGTMAFSMKKILSHYDIDICLAANVEEAFNSFSENSFDFILSDINLGNNQEDGYVFLEKVRSVNKTIPFIMMSGYNKKSEQEKTCALGATAYVQTPFKIEELLKLMST